MANTQEIFAAANTLGFETAGQVCFGTWNGYAILLPQGLGSSVFANVAVDLPSVSRAERKALDASVKEKGLKGLKLSTLTKVAASFTIAFGKGEDVPGFLRAALDALTASLRACGLAPADRCAVTGAPRPDSLCLVAMNGAASYRPVCAAAIRDNEAKTREAAEENKENGSYLLGFVGALIGMLVGVALNVLGIVFTERIYALLFALVPLAAMFGYKLFKGKMSKGSIIIVILLCLLGVLLIPLFELVVYLVRDEGVALGDAFSRALFYMMDPSSLSEISGELLKRLLFMALGIWIAWKYMSTSTNSSQVSGAAAQAATLRPNPRYAQSAETEPY